MPDEVPAQNALKLELLSSLSGGQNALTADAESMRRLRDWVVSLPVTGRVRVEVPDARWLQVNPRRDPVLGAGHTVVLPHRPRTLTVISPQGRACKVDHKAGFEVKAYLSACGIKGADWAWIAQPDGKVQRFGIAAWNAEKQNEPAAGAWVWAPPRSSGWSDKFSERFIQFLATQGPAPDAEDVDASGQGAIVEKQEEPTTPGGPSRGLKLSDVLNSDSGERRPAPLPSETGSLKLRSDELPSALRDLEVSSSDWGSVGLLQTPTARMRSAGHFSFHYSKGYPYTHGNVFFQPFDWMEAGFRYTDISNRLYGPASLSGTQTYKDKSIDVKFRLWDESAYTPAVAVGLRDIGGTGLFSGEYFVANKRTGDFDWSLGLGWGYVGGRGNLRNPLSVFGSKFDTRGESTGQGGNFSFGRYFRGPAALFGGVQYQTPWDRLTIKAEYEGNDYQHEPQNNNLPQRTPLNVGLVYRATSWVDFTAALERGNRMMFGLTLHTSLDRLTQPKLSDPRPVPVAVARPSKTPDWSVTSRELERQTDWRVSSVEQRDNDVHVVIDTAEAAYWRSRVDRAAAVLHRDAPANVDRFTLTYKQRGVDMAEHVIDRDAWVADKTQTLPPAEKREPIVARAPQEAPPGDVVVRNAAPVFEQGLAMDYTQTFGGPDAFVLYALGVSERVNLRLRADTWLRGSVRLRLIDNYDRYKFTAPSNLPRVRTFLREYQTTSRVTIPYLQLTHVGRIAENQYYSVYGGHLEEMFSGVGGEWLYRPFASRFAFGVDVNGVRQREFEQKFGFRDYRTTTGHATMYWDTGWNDVLATVRAGRYLAGDWGATLELSRVFRNGVRIGAFATRTNVSSAQFGEGSFDKGIFISVPFDVMFTRSSASFANFAWHPLTRDGGAMLVRQVQLYNVTTARSDRTLEFEPAPLPNEKLLPEDRHDDEWKPKSKLSEPYTRVMPKAPAVLWERPTSMNEHRLVEALYAQGFRNIKVEYDPTQRILVTVANDELHPISRAVGRAARTALLQAPVETRGIDVTLINGGTPQVRYEFFDVERLQRYFDGRVSEAELKPYVRVVWLNPAAAERDPLARLGDLNPEAKPKVLASLVPDTFSVSRVAGDYAGAADNATKIDWLRAGVTGAGLVLTSSFLDNRGNRFSQDHANSRWLNDLVRVGNAIPWVALGGAGLAALDGSDPKRSRTGYAALEAGATAFVAATGLKYAIGRARPNSGLSHTDFEWGTRDDRFQAFPSRHTIVAWAVATPFALEYDAPWLYGIAGLTNLARIGSREHWVSDTVASSLLGYGLGRIFWQSSREQAKGEPRLLFDGSSIGALWNW